MVQLLAVMCSARTPAKVPPVSESQAVLHHARLGEVDVAMPARCTADVVIDGKLDEPIWRSAQLLTGFSLYQPTDRGSGLRGMQHGLDVTRVQWHDAAELFSSGSRRDSGRCRSSL